MMLTDGPFGDAELGDAMDAPALLAAMLRAEAALAHAQGRLGIIPADAATAIARTAEAMRPDPQTLVAASETGTLAGALTRPQPDHDWARILAPGTHAGDAETIARHDPHQGRNA
ncbi:hypothetical protein [Paracoccus salsus]|uniref:hypothetical protein n=1 Tax=Paracoccus salsus TaxID=2911061 RepID=UPI001F2930E0|nr:hypothetical protein [Paracoccus salsus]MCF3972222.1 hypothetical protein [Paracoccus salsus]